MHNNSWYVFTGHLNVQNDTASANTYMAELTSKTRIVK